MVELNIEQVIERGWNEHARDPQGVFARLLAEIPGFAEPAQLPAFVGLLAHVAGEHLGRWQDGIAALDALLAPIADRRSPEARAVSRSQAALLFAAGQRERAEECMQAAHSPELPEPSTRVRVLGLAASALAGQQQLEAASALFAEALELAAYGPGQNDPAARALAVTGNNLAAALEELPARSAAADRLMELAAQTARRFWEIAGGWREVERAEYRLAMTYRALGRPELALAHAEQCRSICERNGADAAELFFAHEALARAHRARMQELLSSVEPELRAACEAALARP